jgi:hypothetical protein
VESVVRKQAHVFPKISPTALLLLIIICYSSGRLGKNKNAVVHSSKELIEMLILSCLKFLLTCTDKNVS